MLFRYCWDVKYTAAFGINILHIAQHIFHNPDDKFNNVFDMWYYNIPPRNRDNRPPFPSLNFTVQSDAEVICTQISLARKVS